MATVTGLSQMIIIKIIHYDTRMSSIRRKLVRRARFKPQLDSVSHAMEIRTGQVTLVISRLVMDPFDPVL